MLRVLATTALYLFCFIVSSNAQCVQLGEICSDDCDCCGYGDDNDYGVRCEQRFDRRVEKGVGYHSDITLRKCYKCAHVGSSCSSSKDCCSQKCENSQCVKNHPPPKPCFKSLVDGVEAILGNPPTDDNLCPCDNLPAEQAVLNVNAAVDKKTDMDYINYLPIDSGLTLTVGDHINAPIRKLKVCSNQDCPECDPCAYKLEGLCGSTNTYEFIQEGPLSMPSARGECIEVPIIGRHEYSDYRITFPCLVGGFDDCSAGIVPQPDGHKAGCEEGCWGDFSRINYVHHGYNCHTDESYVIYSFKNQMLYSYGGTAVANVDHFTMPYEGTCQWAGYKIMKQIGESDEFEEVFSAKGSDMHLFNEELDPDLCMNGAKVSTLTPDGEQTVAEDTTYQIIMYLHGKVDWKFMEYGVIGKGSVGYMNGIRRDYNWGCKFPVCKACESYPLKVSEVDLIGNCEQVPIDLFTETLEVLTNPGPYHQHIEVTYDG